MPVHSSRLPDTSSGRSGTWLTLSTPSRTARATVASFGMGSPVAWKPASLWLLSQGLAPALAAAAEHRPGLQRAGEVADGDTPVELDVVGADLAQGVADEQGLFTKLHRGPPLP